MPIFLYKLIGKCLKLYHRIAKPTTRGVRAIIINDQQEFLLVQHQLDGLWYLPGGGLHKNETALDGLKRELHEELGCTLKAEPLLLGTYQNHREYKKDFIWIYVVQNPDLNFKKNLEIKNTGFFTLTSLPAQTSAGTKRRLDDYLNGLQPIDAAW